MAFLRDRRILLVSGAPGSGKTSLAQPLAEALGFALLTKDDIKEVLFTAMKGSVGDLRFSREIGGAAMEVLWALAPHCPRVVLEANFRTRSSYERAKVAALGAGVIEVHCRVPLEEAARRFAERARRERHHPAHPLQEISLEQLEQYAEPFGMTPVIEVDTLKPVGISDLVKQIETVWITAEESSGSAAGTRAI